MCVGCVWGATSDHTEHTLPFPRAALRSTVLGSTLYLLFTYCTLIPFIPGVTGIIFKILSDEEIYSDLY